MMLIPLLVVTLCLVDSSSCGSSDRAGLSAPVTVEVAEAFGVKHAVVFSCCDHCVVTVLRALSEIRIPAFVLNPNDPEIMKLLSPKTFLPWINNLFVGDMGCEGMSQVLENLPHPLFSPPYHWLVFLSAQTWRENFTQPFQKIRTDSDFVVCVCNSHSEFELKELYGVNRNRGRVVVVDSWWAALGGARRIHNNFTPKWYKFSRDRRGNMKGATIRAIVSRMSLSYESTSLFKRTGFGPHDINSRIFLHIKDFFNFSIEERIIDGISSDPEIFHALKQETSDVAVIVMGMIPQRSHDIAYLHAISRLRATITFLQPQVSALQNVFILPFSQDVWILLVILILLIFLFLTLDTRIVLGNNLWTVSDFFLITIAIVCQKGIAKFPQIYSACIVMFFFSIVMALLYSAYAGQIVSLLSIQDPLIKSVKDLSDYKFKLGIDAYPYLKMYFTDSADLSVQKLGTGHSTVPFPDAADFVRKPQNCYCTSDYQAEILKSAFHDEELCKLITFNVPQAEAPLAMAVASQSQYKEILNLGTLRQMEQGLYSRYKNETEKSSVPQCSDARHSVELDGLLFAFYILVGGVVLSTVLLLLEAIIWKLAETAKMKQQHKIHFTN